MPDGVEVEDPEVPTLDELRQVLAAGNPQAVLNHLRLRGGGNSLALIEDMARGRAVEGMPTNLPKESLRAIADRYRSFRDDDTKVKNFAKAARPLASRFGMRQGDMEDAVRAVNRRLTRRGEERLQERIADDPGERFAQGEVLGGLGATGKQLGGGAAETLSLLGNLAIAAGPGLAPGGESFREAFNRRQADAQSRIEHSIGAQPISTTGQIGRAVGRELPLLPLAAGGGTVGRAIGQRIGGEVLGATLGRVGSGLGAGFASSAPRIPEQARQLEQQGMSPTEAYKEATKSALIEVGITGGFSLVGLGGLEDYLSGGGKQGVNNIAMSILRGGGEEAAEELTQAIVENTRTVLRERGEDADVLDAMATALTDPRFGQSYDVAAGTAFALGGGAPAVGALGGQEGAPNVTPEDQVQEAGGPPPVGGQPAVVAPEGQVEAGAALGEGEGAEVAPQDPVAQLDAIPRPQGVSEDVWALHKQSVRDMLAQTPEAGRATVRELDGGLLLDFGEGGLVPVLLATPQEMGKLAEKNIDAAWNSLLEGNNGVPPKGRDGKALTKAAFKRGYLAEAAEAAVILDPEGDAVPVGVNGIMYLNTKGFRPEAWTEEFAHKAFARHIDDQGVTDLRDFLAQMGHRSLAGKQDAAPALLRDDSAFQEAVVERVYKPYLDGAFDQTPEAKGVLNRIFAAFKRFVDRISGTETMAQKLAKKPPEFQRRFRAMLDSIRSGEALATAPVEGARRPSAPGPLQARKDVARKQEAAQRGVELRERGLEQRARGQEIREAAQDVQEEAVARRARAEADREIARQNKALREARKKAIDAARDTNRMKAEVRRAQKESFASKQLRDKAINDAQAAANRAANLENRAKEEAKRAENALAKLKNQERAVEAAEAALEQRIELQTERGRLQQAQVERAFTRLEEEGDRAAARELRRMENDLARAQIARMDADTEAAAETLRVDIRNIAELIAEAEDPGDKKLFKQEIAKIRNKINALRGENAVAKKRLMADVQERVQFSMRTPNVSSLLDANPFAQAIYDQLSKEEREQFDSLEQIEAKIQMELDILGRDRVVRRLRKNFRRGGRNNRYDKFVLVRVMQDVADDAQLFVERGQAPSENLSKRLRELTEMYMEAAGDLGMGLRDLRVLKDQAPALQYEMMLKRVMQPTNSQEKKLLKMPPAEQAAERARIAADNMARFENVLRKLGVDPQAVLSPENMDNALFSQNLALAAELSRGERLGRAAARVGAGITYLTRVGIFGIGSAARITQAGVFAMLPYLISQHAQLGANILTGGLFRKKLAGAEVLAGDVAMLGGLVKGIIGMPMTALTGDAYILSQVRGEGTSLAKELGFQHVYDSELLLPGNSKRKRIARMIMDLPFRLLGAADQPAQGMLAGFLEQTVPRQMAREQGLTGAEFDNFVRENSHVETRSEEVQKVLEAELLDLAAARPFSGKGAGSAALKSFESGVRNSHPLVRAMWAQFFPVFRGAIRGGEQAARAAPLTSLAFLARDMVVANKADATFAERRRAKRQLIAAVTSFVLPAMMLGLLDEDDLEKLSEGEVGDVSFKTMPFTGPVISSYAKLARAMNEKDETTFGEATLEVARGVFKDMLPMRRLVGESISYGDSSWERVVQTSPLGSRMIDWFKARGKDDATAMSATVEVLKRTAPVRDTLLLFDDEFVQELDWPEERDMPSQLPRGEAGLMTALGFRETESITTFRPPKQDGETMTGPKVREYQVRAQEIYVELLKGRDEDDLDKKVRNKLKSRARKRARREVGLR